MPLALPCLAAVALGARLLSSGTGATFHVATTGDDANPGTLARPFATIERARAAVRDLARPLPTGGVTVYLRGGTYIRTSTFALGRPDSGEPGSALTYTAYPGEAVRLLGGVVLPAAGWSVVGPGDPLPPPPPQTPPPQPTNNNPP